MRHSARACVGRARAYQGQWGFRAAAFAPPSLANRQSFSRTVIWTWPRFTPVAVYRAQAACHPQRACRLERTAGRLGLGY
jgi:hypothetical protein